jgi:uncharacterized protein (DUF433 family)
MDARWGKIRRDDKIVSVQSLREWVWIIPDRLSGEPCFRGTRVPVSLLFEYLVVKPKFTKNSS